MGTNSYKVVDVKTGAIMGTYSSRKRAQTKADKLDNAYGAYRYSVRLVTCTREQDAMLNVVDATLSKLFAA